MIGSIWDKIQDIPTRRNSAKLKNVSNCLKRWKDCLILNSPPPLLERRQLNLFFSLVHLSTDYASVPLLIVTWWCITKYIVQSEYEYFLQQSFCSQNLFWSFSPILHHPGVRRTPSGCQAVIVRMSGWHHPGIILTLSKCQAEIVRVSVWDCPGVRLTLSGCQTGIVQVSGCVVTTQRYTIKDWQVLQYIYINSSWNN